MTRSYIFCHRVISIDGKVTGDFLFQNESAEATDVYYQNNGGVCCGCDISL